MPIEVKDGANVITGEAISLYRLLALKGRLELEIKGLKFRGRSSLAILRDLGFKATSRVDMLRELRVYIEKHGPDIAKK